MRKRTNAKTGCKEMIGNDPVKTLWEQPGKQGQYMV